MHVTLEILSNDDRHEVQLRGPTLVGRSTSCDIRAADPRVADHHFAIVAHAGRLYVRDLGSYHGTFVNGRRVETAELIDGDRVQIPGLEVQVREESEDRAALPALRVA